MKFKEEQSNYQKLKDISGDLRMENTNLIIKNRELNKRVKILEENTEKTENLQERLRNALNGKIKSTGSTLKDSGIQTGHKVSLEVKKQTSINLSSSRATRRMMEVAKIFQISLKAQHKKLKVLSIQNSSKVFCTAIKAKRSPHPEPIESFSSHPSPQIHPKAKLYIESQVSLLCRPQKSKLHSAQPKSPETLSPAPAKSFKLVTTSELSISCKASHKPPQRKRLRVVPMISLSIEGLKPASPLSQPHHLPAQPFTLSKCASIIIKPKGQSRSKDHPSPSPLTKASLSLAKTTTSSFPNCKVRAMLVSKPSTSSIIPAHKTRSKRSNLSHQFTFSIVPDLKSLSLYTRSIYNQAESEEFEVFNAANVYKPDLSVSAPDFISIAHCKKALSSETWSVGCKKKSSRLKLASFSVLKLSSSKPSVQSFKIFISKATLDIKTLRRLSYIPESKATDDEETKSNAGGRARRNRAPPRKPAIEEYFNLVIFTQTFQAVKMNFAERDKVGGLNCDELQARALQSGIQFNMYHDWVKEQFVMTANVAAKRPSVMVKK